MNKAEILEIRKQFNPDRCTIDHLCGCYVDYEKKKRLTFRKAFGSLPDEEMYKYLDIFSHTLSGTIGKNLIPLAFPTEQEEAGGNQEFLLRLRDSHLTDDALLEELYDRIIGNYENAENYYIIVAHAVYDVPGRTTDGLEMEDASDEIYDYMLCSICPVKLSKAALGYNETENVIEDRYRDWVVEAPVKGFLFPAFIDRTADIHNMLYYSKKPEDIQPVFIEALFGGMPPLSAPEQRELFDAVVETAVGEDGSYELVRSIHEQLAERISDHADDEEPYALDKHEVRALLTDSGVPEERLEQVDRHYREIAGTEDAELVASNIARTRGFEVETPDVVIKVKPDRSDLVETRIIDGRPCIVIEVNGRVEVNGVSVRA